VDHEQPVLVCAKKDQKVTEQVLPGRGNCAAGVQAVTAMLRPLKGRPGILHDEAATDA
jgi:hypothetical protein